MKKKLLFLISSLFSLSLIAQPVINNTSGTIQHKQTVTINGSGFSTKSPAKPYLWAPFDGSLQPSTLGLIQSWDGNEKMEYNNSEGVGGSGCAKASDGSGVWTLRVDAVNFAWNDLNQKMYLFRKVKRNFDIDNSLNWKCWRLWPQGFGYPNIYVQIGNGSIGVEDIPNGGGWLANTTTARGTTNMYKTDEIIMKANSDPSLDDGFFRFEVNGINVGELPRYTYQQDNFQIKNDNREMTMNFVVHGVKANTTFPSNYRYWADDVYLDDTWARVMLGNAPTWSTSTHKEVQIPTVWTSTNIDFSVNQGSFTDCEQVYLYVVDKDGKVNQNGYPVTFAGTGCITGVEKKMEANIQIYPNPTSGFLIIEGISATDQITLIVKNILGEEVKANHERFSNKIKVNTEHLPTGVYLLNIIHNGKESVHKVIKQD